MKVPSPAINAPVRLLVAFEQIYPEVTPQWVLQAPERDMWVAAALDEHRQFHLAASDFGGRTVLDSRSAKCKQTVTRRPLPWWARYPAGVIQLLYIQGMETVGVNIVFAGEEPRGPQFDYGAGLAFALLWHEIHNQPYTPQSLIEIVDRVRREYIETD